jgi:6-phosphogluconolactonase
MGPDAHVASLFPGAPALYETDRSVVGVHGSPKPPPTRISLTMPVLRRADDVWFLVAGADKAHAVGLALSGAGEVQAPAAGPRGRRLTLWLVDRAAATSVPAALVRLSSP